MWEFGIYNPATKEQAIIFGYDINNAFKRHPSLTPNDWEVTYSEYVD